MPETANLPQVPTDGQSTDLQQIAPDREKTLRLASSNLMRMVNFRRPFDVRRSLFYRQYVNQRDQQFFPDGVTPRANTFASYPYSNVETIATRVTDAYFGYEDWFECRPRGEHDSTAADKMQLVLKEQIRGAMLTQAWEDLVRNILIYGHGGIKVEWDHGFDLLTVKQPKLDQQGQPIFDPTTQQPVMESQQVSVPRNRPRFIPIDVYDLLIDPDGLYIGMMADKTLGQLLREQANFVKQYPEEQPLYYQEALDKLQEKLAREEEPEAVIIRMAEIWDKTANTYTIMSAKDAEAISWKDRRLAYRLASYSGYRNKVYGGEPVLFYHDNNPFKHKQCPILHTGYVRPPNEIFGIGAIEPIADHVESLSKFINMIVDNWNLGINRRYAYDINANIDHEALNRFNTPGGKVPVDGDPSKVLAPLPFFTPEGGDYQLLEVYRGLIEMTSGISDFYSKGVGGPQGNETATGINNVIGESNFKFRAFIRNLELYVMQPLLQQCVSLVQQYITDDLEVQITGSQQPGFPKWEKISPADLIGNFQFELVAANYVTNKTVRQRNLMAFVNIVGTSPYWNQYEGLKALAKAFEITGIDKLLKQPEQVQQEQQAQMSQQIQMQEMLAQHEQRRQNEQIILKGAVGVHQSAKDAESKARLDKKSGSGKGGRPATAQFEGKIPGAGTTSPTREEAQMIGANAMGLGQMGETGQG